MPSPPKSIFPPRLKNEPSGQYDKFITFCTLGSNRTQSEVGRRVKTSEQALSRMANKWQWHDRVTHYDLAIASENAELSRSQTREAGDARRRNEIRRQASSFAAAEEVLQKARLMLSAIEVREIDSPKYGKKKVVFGINAGQAASLLLREYNRLAVASGRDVVLMDDFHMGVSDDGVHSGKKIAGKFEVGDTLYEVPTEEKVASVDQAPPKLPQLEDKPPETLPKVDFTGIEDLYGPKQ